MYAIIESGDELHKLIITEYSPPTSREQNHLQTSAATSKSNIINQ